MADYIDREKYCAEICRCNFSFCDKSRCQIWKAPAADVAEVRHGYWIPISDGEGAECSECGEYYDTSQTDGRTAFRQFQKFYAYCSCCGAKMDGGNDK